MLFVCNPHTSTTPTTFMYNRFNCSKNKIVLFYYERSDHTIILLSAINKTELLTISPFWIHIKTKFEFLTNFNLISFKLYYSVYTSSLFSILFVTDFNFSQWEKFTCEFSKSEHNLCAIASRIHIPALCIPT